MKFYTKLSNLRQRTAFVRAAVAIITLGLFFAFRWTQLGDDIDPEHESYRGTASVPSNGR